MDLVLAFGMNATPNDKMAIVESLPKTLTCDTGNLDSSSVFRVELTDDDLPAVRDWMDEKSSQVANARIDDE